MIIKDLSHARPGVRARSVGLRVGAAIWPYEFWLRRWCAIPADIGLHLFGPLALLGGLASGSCSRAPAPLPRFFTTQTRFSALRLTSIAGDRSSVTFCSKSMPIVDARHKQRKGAAIRDALPSQDHGSMIEPRPNRLSPV
jgi:hypothetical protein